ncbi:phosphatidate cytidylyltransferase [Shimia marina]|nr:phosphatidate cytidylyltransferase [Shimia marina]
MIHKIALVASSIIGAGFALLAVMALWPALRSKSLALMGTLLSATLIMLCLCGLFMMGPQVLIAAGALAAARISYEVATLRFSQDRYVILCVTTATVLTVSSALYVPVALACAALWFGLFACKACAITVHKYRITNILLFPVLPFALLAHGAVSPNLTALMLATYVMVEIFDSFALFFGSLLGRTKAFPGVSPNKTVEGLVGGAAALLLAACAAAIIWGFPLALTAPTALLTGGLAVAGDLAASRHKRLAGVKDYPKFLPRQGGLLDSLDSWIAAGGGLTALNLLIYLW